jgi:hypothetical protein
MRNRLYESCLTSGLTLLFFTTFCFAIPAVWFFTGLPLNGLLFWAAAAAAVGCARLAAARLDPDWGTPLFLVSIGISAAIFAASFLIAGYFYDLSYDGQAYHQEAVIFLAQGWNPVYDPPLEVPTGHALWINHYAKAMEYAAAAFYKATGLLEHGKLFNLLMIGSSFLLSFAALLAFSPDKRRSACLVALLLALNPVSVYQALTYYVDGLLASFLLCMLALAALLFKRADRMLAAGFAAAMLFLINIKFTALGYAGIFCIALLIALYMSQQFQWMKKMFGWMAIGGLAGVLLVGYNPYVTNTLQKGHPFYPLSGEDKVDIVQNFTPRNLERLNRFEQAAVSYFSVSRGNSTEKLPTMPKPPFTFTAQELKVFAEPDVAVSGFGPLFGGAIILSGVILAFSFRRTGLALAAAAVIAVLLVSVFINPAPWWARYVPQLWFVPLICVFLGLAFRDRRLMRAVSWTLACVIAANVLLVTSVFAKEQWVLNMQLREQLAELQRASKPVQASFDYSWSNRARFEKLGIAYQEQKELHCQNPMNLVKSGTFVCIVP